MNWGQSVLAVLAMSALGVLVTAPISLGLAVGAAIACGRGPPRGQPLGLPWALRWSPLVVILALVSWAGVFATTAVATPARLPPPAYGVFAFDAVLVGLAILAVRRARRRRAALAVMAAWIWYGGIVSWVALSAIAAGGTLGAL